MKRHIIQTSVLVVATIIFASCNASVRFAANTNTPASKNTQSYANANPKKHHKPTPKNNGDRINANYGKIEKNGSNRSYNLDYDNDISYLPKTYKISQTEINAVKGLRRQVLAEANTWIGTPYCYGGEARSGADCSGFVMEVFKTAGVNLPRTAAEQFTLGNFVDINRAKAGDLVFFSKGSRISHVGIYIGENNIVHSSLSKGVVIQNLSTMGNNPQFAGVKQILKN